MNRRAGFLVLALTFAVFGRNPATAQVVILPTPTPTITAENEPWYLNGEPITYAGSFYYPAGPRVHFNANEMVRTGFYLGIPLYSRTTIEPYSVFYVPIGAGLLQPYERPRTGALAETSGSLASSLRPMPPNRADESAPLQAAGAASQTTTSVPMQVPVPSSSGVSSSGAVPPSRTVGTTGRATPSQRATRTRIGGVPQGSNSIFIEYEGQRWYKSGPAEIIDTGSMSRVGTYQGVPVFTRGTEGIIYVPVTRDGGSLAVPYSKTRR